MKKQRVHSCILYVMLLTLWMTQVHLDSVYDFSEPFFTSSPPRVCPACSWYKIGFPGVPAVRLHIIFALIFVFELFNTRENPQPYLVPTYSRDPPFSV